MMFDKSKLFKDCENFVECNKKCIKFIIYFLVIALLAVGSARLYKKVYKKYYEHRFERVLLKQRKIDPDFWYQKYKKADYPIRKDYKVVFISNNGGEMTYAEYFRYAAERKGWKIKIFNGFLNGHENEVLEFDPDFIIFTCHVDSYIDSRINAHRSKKYSMNLVSFQQMRSVGDIDEKNSYVAHGKVGALNSVVHAVLTVAPEVGVYQKMWSRLNKPFEGFRVFPLVPYFDSETPEPKSLMWLSGGWDSYRGSDLYRTFIKKLTQNIPMKVYGHYNSSSYLDPGVYDGYIAPGMENMKAIRKNGIYLLTHSNYHFEGLGVPSMRIFEATAASAVVISDMHQFPKEHFGDSLLYFDHTKSAEEIYTQIKGHVDWILKNPDKAKEMARKAHKIFLEKFTLEKDLDRIAKMHEYILAKEKAMNLSYPLGF